MELCRNVKQKIFRIVDQRKRGQAAYFVILIDEHICLCMSGSHGKKTSI